MNKIKVLNIVNIIFGIISLILSLWLVLESIGIIDDLITGSSNAESLFGLGVLMFFAAPIIFFIFVVAFILRKIIREKPLLQQCKKYSNFAIITSSITLGMSILVWWLGSLL